MSAVATQEGVEWQEIQNRIWAVSGAGYPSSSDASDDENDEEALSTLSTVKGMKALSTVRTVLVEGHLNMCAMPQILQLLHSKKVGKRVLDVLEYLFCTCRHRG